MSHARIAKPSIRDCKHDQSNSDRNLARSVIKAHKTRGMPNCSVLTFPVDDVFDTTAEEARKANMIHVMFACFLITKCVLWSIFTGRVSPRLILCYIPSRCLAACFTPHFLHQHMRRPLIRRAEIAYRISGVLFMASGWYLLFMVFVFLRPDRLERLRHFALHDITQLQHVAISMCLMGQGALEFVFSFVAPVLTEVQARNWHIAEFVNGALVGFVFTVHPQKSTHMAGLHISLGSALLFGHFFWFQLKSIGFRPEQGAKAYELIAGLCYGVAAVQLLSYEEPEMRLMALRVECHPSGTITYVAIAVGTLFSVIPWIALINSFRNVDQSRIRVV